MNATFSDIVFYALDIIYNYQDIIAIASLALCRIIPIVHTSPFLASKNLPVPVKMGMAVGLFPFMLPNIVVFSTTTAFGKDLILLMLKELLIGYVFGICLSLPFYMMMMAGSSIDHQRGASSLMFSDPIIQIQDSSLGILLMYTLATLYWANELPFTIFEIISRSFAIIPVDKLLPTVCFHSTDYVQTSHFSQIIGSAFSLSIQIASPALVVLLMVDSFLGIANRLAPQVQISFLGQSLKAFAGILVVLICWEPLLKALVVKSSEWIQFVSSAIFSMFS